ncbi:MAG TPA: hypothetical protein VEV17_03480 [Bryobacteraceae bacterium]|nr:hypothetical protein [Bryobacteraceae bacterium]
MKTRRKLARLGVSVPALALGLALCFAFFTPANKLWSASAQVTSPNGSYGILLNQWIDANGTTSALLAVLNFDGAGNITGTYTLVGQTYNVLTGTLTGTYSGNPDGSNTANLSLDLGATVTAVVTLTDGGAGLQFMATGGTGIQPGHVVTGSGRIQSAQGSMPAGSYGLLLNRWPDANNGPQGIFGVVNLDGAGNATGSYTAAGPGVGPAPISGTFTGAYSINPDSTGSLTLNLDIGATSKYAIAITEGGAGVLMLQTEGNGGGLNHVTSGTARLQ